MADVVIKAISGNNILNGSAMVYIPKVGALAGDKSYMTPNGTNTITGSTYLTNVENRYTTRFDDPTYYTA